jgi:hypothetical protein
VNSREQFGIVSNDLPSACTRIVESGDTVRVYSCDDAGLRDFALKLAAGSYYLRQSNLEDLFLKTTGSSLNDLQ